MTSPSIPDLNDAEAGPTEQGREGARLGGERCLRSACRAEPPGAAPRVPPALTPGSRAPPPLCRGRPPDPAPVPSRPLRSAAAAPAPPPPAALTSALRRAGRAGQGSPRPPPPPRSLRSRSGQPRLVSTSGLGEKPPPPGPRPPLPGSRRSRLPFAELPLLRACSAPLPRRSPSPYGPPALLGARLAAALPPAEGKLCAGGGGRVTTRALGRAAALPLPAPLAVLHRGGLRAESEPPALQPWGSSCPHLAQPPGILLAVLGCWKSVLPPQSRSLCGTTRALCWLRLSPYSSRSSFPGN